MELKVNKKTILKVDYSDLETFIDEVYDVRYEIPCGEETGDGSNLKYLVEKEVLDKYDLKRLNNWRMGESEGSFLLSTILTDLCNNDKIEAGEYIVNVSW